MNCDTNWLNDTYRVSGKYFRLPDDDRTNSGKGEYTNPEGTVDQSEGQRDPSLNASGGVQNSPSIRGAEGRAFPTHNSGKESEDEGSVFTGKRDVSLAVSRLTGQIVSDSTYRLVPNNRLVGGEVQVRGRKAKVDVKENRI